MAYCDHAQVDTIPSIFSPPSFLLIRKSGQFVPLRFGFVREGQLEGAMRVKMIELSSW